MKVALVYDRVNKWGGAERVLLALHELFPKAPLYTSVYSEKNAPWAKVFPEIKTSFLQKLPYARKNHEKFALIMPSVFESFDFSNFDLAISVTSEAAKGIITPNNAHVCYCLTPTRYLWSGFDDYFETNIKKLLGKPALNYLRKWDQMAANRADRMISISSEVKDRIKKYYQRESQVIFPPVDLKKFNRKKNVNKEKFFLVVARLVPYKKIDLVIKVFNELKLPLVIVGTGNEEKRLKRKANSNIKFLSQLTDLELLNYYEEARALIFAQVEDFGLAAVEAQAAGTPVIAFKAGGVLDIIKNEETGVFFDKQTPESLISAISQFSKMKFYKKDLLDNAVRFSKENFQRNFLNFLSSI